jgi:hypothetical protein
MSMGKRRTADTRHPTFTGMTSWAAPVTTTTLVHVSRESGDTPPTTMPSRPRTVGPRLHPARHGEYLVVPRRRA